MYFYFSSTYPSAIKLNGLYHGLINDTVKPINISLEDKVFIEVCPLNAEGEQVNFILTEDFILSPPNQAIITDLGGGYLIKFVSTKVKEPFCLLSQERFNNLLVTVYKENGLKISIENGNDFCLEQLDITAESVCFSTFELNDGLFLGVQLFGKAPYVLVYKVNGKIEKVLFRPATLLLEDNALKTKEEFLDMAKHTVICEWDFDGEKLKEKSRTVTAKKELSTLNLPQKLLPFAFLEELLVGGNLEGFICESMQKNAHKLKDYIGDFIGVIPSPLFRKENEVGIVIPNGKGYRVDYFTFEFDAGKIYNIKKSAN